MGNALEEMAWPNADRGLIAPFVEFMKIKLSYLLHNKKIISSKFGHRNRCLVSTLNWSFLESTLLLFSHVSWSPHV